MSKPRTICVNCTWCKYVPDLMGKRGDPDWLNYRCGAVVQEKAIDPVTGKDVYLSHGTKWITLQKHPNCTDMNTGECALYEEK